MANLIEEAKAYVQQRTLNIAELETVPVDVEVKEETDVEYPYKYIEVDNKKYRVPTSVIAQLKLLLEDNPDMKNFKVKKSGEGMGTEYIVIPVIKK